LSLAPVAAAEVVAAVERAGRDNPLLGMATGMATGMVDPQPAVGELVDAVGAWLHTAERRVAASLVVLGYSARLLGPTLAVMLRDGILLDVRPGRVRYSYAPNRGFRLTLPEPAGWRGSAEALRGAWCRDVVDAHLGGLVDAVRGVVPVAAGLLWGNVASGLAGALRALAQGGAVPLADCHATGLALLGHGPLRDSGTLSVHSGQLTFVRRSCCLYYRIEGGGLCGDCALAR
jgi:ferric iron reductase protein FhuF